MASSLTAFGMNVWWDIALKPGNAYAREIDAIIRDVDHVVVLWSPNSVQSEWVIAEASLAKELGKLIPIKIAACEPIVNLRLLHTPQVPWLESQDRFERLETLTNILLGKSAESGESPAAFSEQDLSCLPARDVIIRALRGRTFEQLQHDAAQDPLSRWIFGAALLDGVGIEADPVRGADLIIDASREGLLRALHTEAVISLLGLGRQKDVAKGLALMEEAAAKGVAVSQWELGMDALWGRRGPKDAVKAFQYFHSAALKGHPGAQGEVGNAYRTGAGAIKDPKEARFWLEKGAAAGDTFSLLMLGAMAADGDFPGQGHAYAAQQYEAVYHAGDARGAHYLGLLLSEQNYPTYNLEAAARWYIKAGRTGRAESYVEAAKLIMSSNGALNHVDDPVYLLAQAADLKDPAGLVMLGEALLDPRWGKRRKADAREAFGQALAMPNLGPALQVRCRQGLKRCHWWP